MKRKGKRQQQQKGESRRFPVIRIVLVLVLLTAAILLVFWRDIPKPLQTADEKPAAVPEVILKPLPEGEKPPAPQPEPKAATPAATQAEKPRETPIQAEPRRQVRTQSPETGAPPQATPTSPPIKAQYRKARLFFAAVDAEGKIAMKSVIRAVPIGDSPLWDTLASLLKGPTPQEINLGLLSMIPTGSRLLSAVVKKDTVVLDFNETFRYNTLGMEGQLAQLRQVVFAATEFSNVKKVQILIDGKKVDFLGAEGIPIGKPLDRESLRD